MVVVLVVAVTILGAGPTSPHTCYHIGSFPVLRTLGGADAWDYDWQDQVVNRLREAVGRIPFWTSHADSDERNLLAF
jgi:hypothetical protein